MIIILADRKEALIAECQRLNIQAETFVGDPLDFDVDGIVSPANTIGEMSGGYDLVIRNRLGVMCERNIQESIREKPVSVGEARAVPSGNSKVPVIVVAPTLSVAGGKILDAEIVFQATRAAVLAGHDTGVQRLGMVGMGTGYGDLDIYAAARALAAAIDDALDDIAGLTG
jgi:O-acetyl-ADP-ribose deacetylase (regulator of RNase III)